MSVAIAIEPVESTEETWSDERAFVARLLQESSEDVGKALEQVDPGCIGDTTLRRLYALMGDSYRNHGEIRHRDLLADGITHALLAELAGIDSQGIFTPSKDLIPHLVTAGLGRKVSELTIVAGQEALTDPVAALARLDAGLVDIAYKPNAVDNSPMAILRHILDEAKENMEGGSQYPGVATAYTNLSNFTGGFRRGHLWICGAYTSVGKTQFSIEQIYHLLLAGRHVIVFSTEMSVKEIMLRLQARHSGATTSRILMGRVTPDQWALVKEITEIAQSFNLRLYDDVYKVDQMRLIAKRDKAAYGELDLVIIDFVQNVAGEGSAYERISAVALDLQRMARQVDATVLALSQISNEAAKDESPGILGYKNAGELAAACDVGLMLRRGKPDTQNLMLTVHKNRHGKTGTVSLRFNDNFTALKYYPEGERS